MSRSQVTGRSDAHSRSIALVASADLSGSRAVGWHRTAIVSTLDRLGFKSLTLPPTDEVVRIYPQPALEREVGGRLIAEPPAALLRNVLTC